MPPRASAYATDIRGGPHPTTDSSVGKSLGTQKTKPASSRKQAVERRQSESASVGMSDEEKKRLETDEYDLVDVIIGRPQEFKVGRKSFRLYPLTLAKTLLLKRQMDTLGLNMEILKANPFLEALRIVRDHRQTCCTILAYHTAPNTRKDLFDTKSITIRRNYFDKNLDDGDIATLLITALDDKTDRLIKHLGLDKEQEKLKRVMEVKKKHDKNTVSFCGLSLFGTFIGQLKEMGYSDDEILYERGYTFLRLMLADKIQQIILSDDEKKELPSDFGGDYVDANDPKNAQKVMAMFANKGIKKQ